MRHDSRVPVTESLSVVLRRALDGLLEQVFPGGRSDTGFEEVRRLLEAVPLASGEFGVAVNRLENARRYLHAGEHGAARYELCLLRRSLGGK
jgi:hypothetical protein